MGIDTAGIADSPIFRGYSSG